jgi:hypothetical protein
LRKDGTLLVSVVHPLADLDLLDGPGPDPSDREETYFDARRFETEAESGGLRMRFAGWARPLEAYASAIELAGLAITSVREPARRPDRRAGPYAPVG